MYEVLYEFYGFEELKRSDKMRSIKATAVSCRNRKGFDSIHRKEFSTMLNRIGAVAASATLITVGTLALSGAALLRSEPKLGASKVDYGQEHSSMPSSSDRFSFSLPTLDNLSKPNAFFCSSNWLRCH
ncbi:hypothetical protein [Coleofasciculus sp. FACHB-1120]|uniref:hypothetical protein n=1 Tax=Coleofasciculus sp. FACHB-1120 TaxID=2692783 RepID=UPI001687CC7F|nr:hypothetical protein [Coleofasciculus sp. FACHB-1120]MBD2743798.1 hypothetical protein [Coleofasciculus sp. FACHB-1120]